ncbi:MAG: cytochrome c biogenesis protein CcsA, partial [Cyanobacteriota bacterium]
MARFDGGSVNDPVVALGIVAFSLLLLLLPSGLWAVSGGKSHPAVRVIVASANLALTAQLVLRWWDSGHFPISNLYESL